MAATLESLDKKIDEVMEMLQRLPALEALVKKVEAKVDSTAVRCNALEAEGIKTTKRLDDIEAKYVNLKKRCADESKQLSLKQKNVETILADAIETGTRLRNIRVSQVPALEGEKLGEIVGKLFTLVGARLSSNVGFYRLKTGRSLNTIIINFNTESEKEQFLRRYWSLPKKTRRE